MIKNTIRQIARYWGYDIIKVGGGRKPYPNESKEAGYSFYRTPIGQYYLPAHPGEDVIANAMMRGLLFEPEIVALGREFIKPGTAVLDVGANFGQMSLQFAQMAGQEGKVYAFEAQQRVFEILRRNIEANKAHNVNAVYGAVYDENGLELHFPEPDMSIFGSLGSYGIDPQSTTGTIVKSFTIDSLKIEQPISFMKVDIQGSDLAAMKGAIHTIQKHQMPIVFEFEEQFQEQFQTSFQDYVEFVAAINYRFERTIQKINYLVVPRSFNS